jgi:F-type H+-transporting ATPase subunit alpha
VEVLKQDQYQPLTVEQQILIIYASSNKYLDDIEVSEVRRFERELYPFIETNYPGVMKTIREKKALDDSLRAEMKKALDAFKETFVASLEAAKAAAAGAEKTAATEAAAPGPSPAEKAPAH